MYVCMYIGPMNEWMNEWMHVCMYDLGIRRSIIQLENIITQIL